MNSIIQASRDDAERIAKLLREERRGLGDITARARAIIEEVREKGDEALIKISEELDGVKLSRDSLVVYREEMRLAAKRAKPAFIRAMKRLKRNIAALERKRLERLPMSIRLDGYHVKASWKPISDVGCYVPGGRACYPSTALMTGVPGEVAGVPRLVMASPPKRDPAQEDVMLAAAYVAGFGEVIRLGGAQAIAALAYGTESIKPVKKIIGPGNPYVVAAKNIVYPLVDVDFPAGPTELLVVIDRKSEIGAVAADMLAQAEHSPDTLIGAVSQDVSSLERLRERLITLLREVPRDSAAALSITRSGFFIHAKNREALVKFINALAPEHLVLDVESPERLERDVWNAGVVTVGRRFPSVVIDYYAGPSHVLPTGGSAAVFGCLTVLEYVKPMHFVYGGSGVAGEAYKSVGELVRAEGLPLHLEALRAAAPR